MTTSLLRDGTATSVAATWYDPEFWGPIGHGCSRCHEYPPFLFFSYGGLCFPCLARCFKGWEEERLLLWLAGQHSRRLRLEAAGRARKAYRDYGSIGPALEYEKLYGVWLLDRPHP